MAQQLFWKNNVLRYFVIKLSEAEQEKIASAEDVFAISERPIRQIIEVYVGVKWWD